MVSTELRPLSPHPALVADDGQQKILAISDLHLGWEVGLSKKGVHIPSQTTRLLSRLKQIVSAEEPDSMLVLGDVRYSVEKIETEEWRDVPLFFEEIGKVIPKVMVIPGNHDGNLEALLPSSVDLLSRHGMIVGDAGFFHGHTWPPLNMLSCTNLVVGHVHPVVLIRDPMGFRITRQVWVKALCDAKILASSLLKRENVKINEGDDPADLLEENFDVNLRVKSLLIIPSFNDFLGGRAINRPFMNREKRFQDFIGPVLRSGSVNINEAEIYLLDGAFLGTLSNLRKLS